MVNEVQAWQRRRRSRRKGEGERRTGGRGAEGQV
jgi:hypothetical protein